MAAAKRRGRHVGRPPKLTPHKIDHARALIAEGKETRAGAAALLGVGVATLRRALNGRDDLAGSPGGGHRRIFPKSYAKPRHSGHENRLCPRLDGRSGQK
jgi:hypothetical protein